MLARGIFLPPSQFETNFLSAAHTKKDLEVITGECSMSLKVGTRGSRLALAQTATVIKKIQALGIEVEQKIISTQGDEVTGVPLHAIGKQGVFVRGSTMRS